MTIEHQKGDKYRVIQHRFGWTDQDGDDNKYRFGKGTLRPANLDQILNYSDPNNSTKIDLIIPFKDLQNGEICIPHYQGGEEVLNFRSPFLNSNGLCVSTNKVVEDILGPDGQPLGGAIAVSDETSERIYNRINEQIKSVLPEAQSKNIQLEGIKNYLDKNISKLETKDKIEFTNKFNEYILELKSAGYELEILPQESEQERQARDYDGDCIGFERASKYPNLTTEAKERNLPENAYEPTVKLKKQSFYQEDGSQPEFEEIAIHMSDGISVGVINNHLTSIEALESEITILKNFGNEKDQLEYVQQVAKHYEDLFKTEAWAKFKGIEGKEIPTKYRSYMEEFIKPVRQ